MYDLVGEIFNNLPSGRNVVCADGSISSLTDVVHKKKSLNGSPLQAIVTSDFD